MRVPGIEKCVCSFILTASIGLSATGFADEQAPATGTPEGQIAAPACFPLTSDEVITFTIDSSNIEDHVAVNSESLPSYITIKSTDSMSSAKKPKFELGFGPGISGDWPAAWEGVCNSGRYELQPANSDTAKIDKGQRCEHRPSISMYKDSGQRQIDITIGTYHGGGVNGGKGCKEHEGSGSHGDGDVGARHNGDAHGGE